MNRWATRVWWVVAWAVLGLGLVLSLQTARQQGAARQRLQRRQQDSEALHAMLVQQAKPLAILATLEEMSHDTPPPLRELLAAHGPDAPADLRRREVRASAGGWQAERWEVHFESVDLAALAEWCRILEWQQPPWRLIEGDWHHTDHPPGAARAILILEGLHRIRQPS